MDVARLIKERWEQVEERIAAACRRAVRSREEVALVAVTKTINADVARVAAELGLRDLGESRPQELWHKAALVPTAVRWHLIGHLQRNKVERTLPLVHLIHSVDSLRLLQAMDQEAQRQERSVTVLLEVNAGGETSKQGLAAEELQRLAQAIAQVKQVSVAGLMTMAPLQAPEACRATFAKLRELRERLQPQLRPVHDLRHLSMGMSNDFEVAIEEGATILRLGSVLFEGLPS